MAGLAVAFLIALTEYLTMQFKQGCEVAGHMVPAVRKPRDECWSSAAISPVPFLPCL